MSNHKPLSFSDLIRQLSDIRGAAQERLSDLISAYFRRPIRHTLLLTVASGTLLQFIPQLTSTTLEAHMRQKGLPDISQHFDTANIRVLHRSNPLQIPYMTVFSARAARTYATGNVLQSYIFTPVRNFYNTTMNYITPHPLTASSFPQATPHEDRHCTIRPPAMRSNVASYVNAMTSLDGEYQFEHDPQLLAQIMYTAIMAHEGRHCDQNHAAGPGTIRTETDADAYALDVVRVAFHDNPSAVAEAAVIWRHMRAISAVAGGDSSHGSGLGLGAETAPTATEVLNNEGHSAALRRNLRSIIAHNRDAFDSKDRSASSRSNLYYAAQAALAQNTLPTGPIRDLAADYIAAIDYFNSRSAETLLNPIRSGQRIDTRFIADAIPPSLSERNAAASSRPQA